MLIVDSQVHIWKSGTPVIIHRQIPQYTKDDLLKEMAEGGVDLGALNGGELALAEGLKIADNRFDFVSVQHGYGDSGAI